MGPRQAPAMPAGGGISLTVCKRGKLISISHHDCGRLCYGAEMRAADGAVRTPRMVDGYSECGQRRSFG
jgi:hypothetical protein